MAVSVGPGSFTGLRVGVSFGLGLAMGLAIPIVALRTLHLQAGRTDVAAIAVDVFEKAIRQMMHNILCVSRGEPVPERDAVV